MNSTSIENSTESNDEFGWDQPLQENSVEVDLRTYRMNICKACPELIFKNICDRCLCFMPAKTYLKGASCPLNKW